MTARVAALIIAAIAFLGAGCGTLPEADRALPERGGTESHLRGQTFEEDVELIRGLTEDHWARRFAESGARYRPLAEFIPYRGNDGPDCGGEPAVPNNAFYCPAGHFVAYDETWMRAMYEEMGDASVYLIIPHEIGHAVQAQLMTDFSLNKERELQADCYAGGALGALVREGRLAADPGDDQELMYSLAAAGDPSDEWWRPDAHGTASERQAAFANGYNNGVAAC